MDAESIQNFKNKKMKKIISSSISYIFQKCLGIEMDWINHMSLYYLLASVIFHYSLVTILHNRKLCSL